MIGLPTETAGESLETIRFAQRLNPDFAQFTLTVPYPGCALYDEAVAVDEETSRLLDFSNELFEISDGLFDVTSGVLRQIWTFDGSDQLPDRKDVKRAKKDLTSDSKSIIPH